MRWEFTERVRQAVSAKDDGEIFGIGDDFRPDGDPEEAFWGFYLWEMSERQRLPTREEVQALDRDWVSDIFWVANMAKWVKNTSAFFAMIKDKPEGGEIDVQVVPPPREPPKQE